MICHARRAAGVRPADGLSELFVAARFAIGDVAQRRPDPLLEGRAVQAAGKIERPARPGKILVQLTEYPCGQRDAAVQLLEEKLDRLFSEHGD